MPVRLRQNSTRKNLTVDVTSPPVPTGGWDAMSPLANMKPGFAVTLENWFPQPGYVELRKGFDLHAPMGAESVVAAVETLMTYQGVSGASLWAGMTDTIYDVTTDGGAAVAVVDVGPFANVRFQWINFATSGGNFLWACNGADDPIYYDGTIWDDTAITGVTPGDIINVTSHRGRLWLTIKDSTTAAYLPIDSIQGAAITFDVGGEFTEGGYLVGCETWTRDGGSGPDDYLVFLSSRGQAAVYSIVDPDDPDAIYLVGVYSLATPLGRRCMEKIGPDISIITNAGVQSLSQAAQQDRASQATATITTRIQPAINATARISGDNFGWQFISYPRGTRAILNVPITTGEYSQYVMNTLTGAWCRFTGQNAHCWALMNDRLFFGGDGLVLEADVAGGDFGGVPFVADVCFAFSYYGNRGRKKRWPMLQLIMNTNFTVIPSVGMETDFRISGLLDPVPSEPSSDSLWDVMLWDADSWAGATTLSDNWLSVEAIGYAAAPHIKVTVAGQTLGRELVTNGLFDNWTGDDPNGFTVTGEGGGNEVTEALPGAQFISDGTLLSIEQACMTTGSLYYVSITVSDVTDGGLQFGSKADVGDEVAAIGVYSRQVLATAGDGEKVYVRIAGTAATDATITRLSVKEILTDGSVTTGQTATTLQLTALNVTSELGEII